MRVVHLARKPLSEPSVAANVLRHGTGALHVAVSRVAYQSEADMTPTVGKGDPGQLNPGCGPAFPHHKENWGLWRVNAAGRWPANVILGHLPECTELCEPGCPVADLDTQSGDRPVSGAARTGRPAIGGAGTGVVQFGVEAGNGTLHNDRGGASRFFRQVGRKT